MRVLDFWLLTIVVSLSLSYESGVAYKNFYGCFIDGNSLSQTSDQLNLADLNEKESLTGQSCSFGLAE